MSTGLTWVTCNDTSTLAPTMTYCQCFSDYNEAIGFALYNSRAMWSGPSVDNTIMWVIYTTSPSSNGYVQFDENPVFVPFD